MPTDTTMTTGIRRTLTFFYIGRPASLYIEAIGLRRLTRPDAAPRCPGGTEEQCTGPVDGRQVSPAQTTLQDTNFAGCMASTPHTGGSCRT
jgi:hypothetical protein